VAAKFFVTVIAPDRRALAALSSYEFDLFHPTAQEKQEQFSIEGLLALEQVGRLVEDGYQVLVEEESSKRARARTETAEFRDWLKEMER
jgi:hypothetical protein